MCDDVGCLKFEPGKALPLERDGTKSVACNVPDNAQGVRLGYTRPPGTGKQPDKRLDQ